MNGALNHCQKLSLLILFCLKRRHFVVGQEILEVEVCMCMLGTVHPPF